MDGPTTPEGVLTGVDVVNRTVSESPDRRVTYQDVEEARREKREADASLLDQMQASV